MSRRVTPHRLRIAACAALSAVIGAWFVIAVRQVADGGFYSDDWAIQEHWKFDGYSGAVSRLFETLGSKPLLAVALPAPYEAFGSNPVWHQLLAAGLALASAGMFYLVLRKLHFRTRDAAPIALIALLFPWASAVRLWPTGSMNNIAVLLLFAGFLLALRGLGVRGWRGLLVHIAAAACYAASILFYETTTVVALTLWPAYAWLHGWRPAVPRALLDISAAGAAAVYSAANTEKTVNDISYQLSHLQTMVRDGADLLAASLVPVSLPDEFPPALTILTLASVFVTLAVAVLRRRSPRATGAGSRDAMRWAAIGALALAVLALCWAIYLPSSFTPTQPGLWDRINILALYPIAVFVYAVLRTAGCLISEKGYALAIAGSVVLVVGYIVQDVRHQRDWARSWSLQETVLTDVVRAAPPDGSVVLTFGHPAEVAPSVPVFNASWDLFAAARVRTGEPDIDAYPVYTGSRLRCSLDGVTIDYLASPYDIDPTDNGTPRTPNYDQVVFVDVSHGQHAVIRSRDECRDALRELTLGPFRASS